MPRRRREMVGGGLYHVYNRFARGEDVFADPEEAVDFVERLRLAGDRDGLAILAWCLMSNHYHLVIRVSSVPLSRTMHAVQNGFSRDFNRRWRRTGPLWQSRYKAKLITDEGYLAQAIVYVHLNPVRAGIAERPAEYRFSGHRELMGKVRSPLCDVDEGLLSFGQTVNAARKSYGASLKAAMKAAVGGVERLENVPWWTADRRIPVDENRVVVDVLGRSSDLERPALDAKEFIELACGVLEVDVADIASRLKGPDTVRARRLVATCGIERWAQKAGEMASVLGKHPVVVSRWVREAWDLKKTDSRFTSQLDSLDRTLSGATTGKSQLTAE